jgi:anti-sigma B factor antagonist
MVSPVEIQPEEQHPSGEGYISVNERLLDEKTAEVAVEGELDLATAPNLKWPLLDSLKAGRTRLLVNLSQVTFIDSTALSVLVGVHRKLPEDARMAVVCTNPNVLRIFAVAGLDAAFDIFPTAEAALVYLRGGSAESPRTEEQTSGR